LSVDVFGLIIDTTTGENDMDITKALEIVQDKADSLGLPVLETLMYMGDNLDDLFDSEVRAYRVAMRDFRKLFAEV
jgi:hypothetical protein